MLSRLLEVPQNGEKPCLVNPRHMVKPTLTPNMEVNPMGSVSGISKWSPNWEYNRSYEPRARARVLLVPPYRKVDQYHPIQVIWRV